MGYNKISSKGPYSRHSYRQSDSYAFALNYYYENNKFLEPSILFVGEDKGGKTVSEFPILYCLTAKIWNLTGVNPFIPRLLNLIIIFLGLFYLYKLSFEILNDHLWAITVSLFLYSSPLLGFYSFNFIPNIPALGISLVGCYYFYKYHTSSKTIFLIVSSILFSLGALIKVSSLFSFLAINTFFFIYNILHIKQNNKVIVAQVVSSITVLITIYLWYSFAKDYNSKNLGGIFNQSIIPIWSLSSKRIQSILDVAYTNTVIYFLNPVALIALGLMFLTSFLLWKNVNKKLLSITALLFVGIIMFILLFFDGMDAHEYFLTDSTVIIPAITLTFLTAIKNYSSNLFISKYFKGFAVLLLILSLNYNMAITRAHFNPHDKMVTKNIPLPSRVLEYWNYCYWDWEIHLQKYEGIIPYIRDLGIKFEDRVISIPDETPNRTLTLLNQKGFTDYHYNNNYQGIKRTERKIELGAKYMIVEGDENLQREDVAPFIQNQIGSYKGIKIFKISDTPSQMVKQ
jgi:hypothetical protein